ncbi:MAG: chemotaxis protein CheW [Planctomycetaceae bacterium]|nr:chemotaxis protein CheW [Planctomycetaceae bacterium]
MAITADTTALHENHTYRTGEGTQLVGFRLGSEEYGIEITKVQEIILLGEITSVPQAPDFVKGLINLRSTVIPVIDLRLRLGMSEQPPTEETRIMVVHVHEKTLGLVVDAVSEVLRATSEQIVPPPSAVTHSGREPVSGLVKLDDRLLILLDVDRLLDMGDTLIAEAALAAV